MPKPMAARRAKAVGRTQPLLARQATCRMYGFGVAGPEPQRSLLWLIGGAVCFSVVLAAFTGIVLIPGLLAFAIARRAINPPRGVAITDRDIAVTRETAFDARPNRIVGNAPLDQVFVVVASTRSHVCVRLGADPIWLRRREHEILVTAAQAAHPQTV